MFADVADAFQLSGVIGQLEQVWRVGAGPNGAGPIMAALKSTMANARNGPLTLSSAEQQAIKYMVPSYNVIRYETLKRDRRTRLCRLHDPADNLSPQGTGFLVNGKSLSSKLDDATYLLTNAHLISNPKRGGAEVHPIRLAKPAFSSSPKSTITCR